MSTFSNDKFVSQGVVSARFLEDGNLRVVTKSGGVKNYELLYSSTDSAGITRHGFNEVEGDGRVRITEYPGGYASGRILDDNLSFNTLGDLSFQIGVLPEAAVLPTGFASYTQSGGTQDTGIVYISVNGTEAETFIGDANLTADFGADRVFGTLFDGRVGDSDIKISLSGGKLVGSEFFADGGISVAIQDDNDLSRTVVDSTGQLLGQFTGQTGQAAVGSYGGEFETQGANGLDEFDFSGAFVAEQTD